MTQYRIKSAAPFPVDLLIEEPRRAGAVLTSPDPKNVEMTAGAYRIPLAFPAGGQRELSVVAERPVEEAIRLFDVGDNQLGGLVAAGEIDPPMRAALQGVVQRRQAMARLDADLARLRRHRAGLAADEKRLRDNLAALGNDPELRKRLIDQFAAADSAIENDSASIAKVSDALAAAERDLNAYVSNLTL
jgi:hypothetical protein